MSESEPRTVKVTRAQALAAQLIEKLDRRSGSTTDASVARVAAAGRSAGVVLPAGVGKGTKPSARASAKTR